MRCQLEPLLLTAPVAGCVVASADPLAAQVAFTVGALLALTLSSVARRLPPRTSTGDGRIGVRSVIGALVLPLVAASSVLTMTVVRAVTPPRVDAGLDAAAWVAGALATVLVLPGLPTPAGRLAVRLLGDRPGAAARGVSFSRGVALRVATFAVLASLLAGWRPAVAACVMVGAWLALLRRARRAATRPPRFVAEIASPVVILRDRHVGPASLRRLANVGVGVLPCDGRLLLIRHDDLAALVRDGRAATDVGPVARPVAAIDGALAADRLPDALDGADQAVVMVGDLVVGVVGWSDARPRPSPHVAGRAGGPRR